jgi:Tol biopolymer transport system component
MDDFVRELMRTRKSKNIARLSGNDAALAGQSVWNYIAEKYGKSSVSNILNYTRVTRNEEKSVMITLGISFKQLMVDWRKYYSDISEQVYQSYVSPKDSLQLTPSINKTTGITTVKLSPDGRYLAYAENDRGRYIVRVRSLETGKDKVILSGGSKVIDQRVDYKIPLISWADATTLGVVAMKQGKFVFWLYDLSTRTKLPRALERFSNIRSLSFSGNGRLGILSGDFEGQSDLFLISTRRERVSRITNDVYDDLDPAFIPGTNRIVFSSNRETDTLNVADKTRIEKLTNNYNLFVYDLDTTKNVLARITNTLSMDFAPLAIDQNNFVYLSDQRGIVNLFKYSYSTGIYSQLTNYASSIKHFDLVGYTLAVVTDKDLEEHIYLNRNFSTSRQIFTPATRRKELQQVRIIRERRKQEEDKNMSIKDMLNAR